jgi:hypothetical protein
VANSFGQIASATIWDDVSNLILGEPDLHTLSHRNQTKVTTLFNAYFPLTMVLITVSSQYPHGLLSFCLIEDPC